MESVTTRKLPKKRRSESLFVPPSYCRKAENTEFDIPNNENIEVVPSLKLPASNPSRLLQLIEKLTDDSSKTLEVKINAYLIHEAKCKLAFLIHLLYSSEEAVVQTIGKEELEKPLRLPVAKEVITQLVNYQNQALKCGDNLNPQLAAVFDEMFVDVGHKFISIPILSKQRKHYPCSNQNIKPVLLVCLVDSQKDEDFVIRLTNEVFKFCLTILLNTVKAEEEARQKQQCQTILAVVRKLFSHLTDVNDLLKVIMSEVKRLTSAKKCSLYLIDPDDMRIISNVFDTTVSTNIDREVKFINNHGITEHVATTGRFLNIEDPHDHPLFCKGTDEVTEFKTRNILCFPIRDENHVTGVVLVRNKMGCNFNHFDEEVVNMLSIYCGLSIKHSLGYKQVQDVLARNKISTEVILYRDNLMTRPADRCHCGNQKCDCFKKYLHGKLLISDDDVTRKLTCRYVHVHPQFDLFGFSPRTIVQRETICFVLRMFEDLGFINIFSIKKDYLIRFLLFLEKSYHEVPYHNWMHAFSVAHFAYLCLKKFELVEKGYITNLEAMAYLIACLSHDVDHRDTNNVFQVKYNSTLAGLYSSQGSVMERYNLTQTLNILQIEECNFLECLNSKNYSLCLDLIKDMVLATDLARHFKIYNKQHSMVQEGYNKNNPEHRYIFVCLLMTAADLSDQIKDWSVVREVSEHIFEEFYKQGDLEKELGREPMEILDREKAVIVDLQTEFLTEVCLPIYKLLSFMFPVAKELVYRIKQNILFWESSRCMFSTAIKQGRSGFEVLANPELKKEVEAVIKSLEQAN